MREIVVRTAVVGSGCAGLNAADWLAALGEEVLLITEDMNSGTSRNTGSDKQTYYKLSLAGDEGDSIGELAETLAAPDVDGDIALCEAAGSARSFFKLVQLGVPFPCNEMGEYVGYQTDHDTRRRATSAGPLTSRYMTEELERSVRGRNIPILNHTLIFRILTDQNGVCGLLGLDTHTRELTAVRCAHVILATGGAAGVYADRTSTTYGTTLETSPSCGYYIMTEWVIDGYQMFVLNPDDPLVQDGWFSVDGEHMLFTSSQSTRSELFWSGELDQHTLTGTEYDQYKDDPRVHKNMTASVWGLFVNSASSNTAMANKDLRLALQYAAPREEMAYDVYKMYTAASYMVAESIFVDDGEGGTIYRKTEEAEKIKEKFATNRELALEYFDKAYEALGGKKITVGYIYFDEQEDQKRTAEVAKEIYEGLFGTDRFELKLEAVLPTAAYDRYRAGTYDMGIGVRLCSPFNPYTSMAPWTTDYADKYITGFDNEEFDKLQYDCVYGELLNDPKAKIAALNRMEELLLGEVAFIPLMQNDNSVIYNERIWLPTEEFLTGVGYGWQQSTIENPAN